MNRDESCLKAILREIDSIPLLMKGYNKESFLKSEKTQKAVCMMRSNDPVTTGFFVYRTAGLVLDKKPGVSRMVANQLLRSGTSIGANIQEGQTSL